MMLRITHTFYLPHLTPGGGQEPVKLEAEKSRPKAITWQWHISSETKDHNTISRGNMHRSIRRNRFFQLGTLYGLVLLPQFAVQADISKGCDSYYGKKCPTPVFVEDFANLDIWRFSQSMSGAGNGDFVWYTNTTDNIYVKDGVLHIRPTLTSDYLGEDKMKNGADVDLGTACTDARNDGCHRKADGNHYINPIRSGNINTKQTLHIKYGQIEVEAKLPKGDWLWPAIWMLPVDYAYGGWPASGEIDLMEARGNNASYPGGVNTFSSTVHWVNQKSQQAQGNTFKYNRPLSDDFHTYTLSWDTRQISTYFDEEKVMTVNYTSLPKFKNDRLAQYTCPSAPFDQPFNLILWLSVGSTNGWFPETSDPAGKKPWKNGSGREKEQFWDNKERGLYYILAIFLQTYTSSRIRMIGCLVGRNRRAGGLSS
ncbi:hypothetical protein SeLEV6574_g07771 [Synchytrium endobioticum]|uniref:GH16 domain-containing protein n=1 Tax=Synchytrium endobioticum TaxID=286115 RepID=A0A507CGV6_9FUNG|nr:hypothetical protein SeLEV6574_g07771 [Synchytrium endobioticum]